MIGLLKRVVGRMFSGHDDHPTIAIVEKETGVVQSTPPKRQLPPRTDFTFLRDANVVLILDMQNMGAGAFEAGFKFRADWLIRRLRAECKSVTGIACMTLKPSVSCHRLFESLQRSGYSVSVVEACRNQHERGDVDNAVTRAIRDFGPGCECLILGSGDHRVAEDVVSLQPAPALTIVLNYPGRVHSRLRDVAEVVCVGKDLLMPLQSTHDKSK